MDNLLEKYTKLNNSFKKEYIFHMGAGAGFYSEFCNMVLAILYCLKYEYKFTMYSQDANFGYKNGWSDFFLPFCDETQANIHHLYNTRFRKPVRKRHYLKWILYRTFNKNKYFTYELWDKYFCKEYEQELFDIPQLGIHGDLRAASTIIAKMIYRYNDKTIEEINLYKEKVNLPPQYASMQIRRGDKTIECKLCPTSNYFDALKKHTDIKSLFVLTDDYNVIEEIEKEYSGWEIATLTTPDEHGYNNDAFSKTPIMEKKEKLIKLFSSIEIIRESELFIGTYTTNSGLFLGMVMPYDKVISVQKKSWFRFDDADIKEQLV